MKVIKWVILNEVARNEPEVNRSEAQMDRLTLSLKGSVNDPEPLEGDVLPSGVRVRLRGAFEIEL